MFQSDSSEADWSDLCNDGFESLESMTVFTVKVEYYRSFEYAMQWSDPMNPIRKSKRLKRSPKDLCVVDPVQRRTSLRRLPSGRREEAQCAKSEADDLIDIINRSNESETEVTLKDEGVDQSEDDTESVRSGPAFPCKSSAEKPERSLCPTCCKLYQKVKRMKAPLKHKPQDYNPKSPTCDQWVLLKLWSSRILPDSRVNLSELILKMVRKDKKEDQFKAEEVCSRPHLFLTRNLRRCLTKPPKKRGKRPRKDSQGPRVAKQQRLLDSSQPIKDGVTHTSPDPMSSCSSVSSLDNGGDSDQTQHLLSVTLERDSLKANLKQNVPKRGGFKELLAQLRGNHSMIIRESTT